MIITQDNTQQEQYQESAGTGQEKTNTNNRETDKNRLGPPEFTGEEIGKKWDENFIYQYEAKHPFDIPEEIRDTRLIEYNFTDAWQKCVFEDLMLAHRVTSTGTYNRWGCRIPVHSN